MNKLSKLGFVILSLCCVVVFSGWGFLAHRTINQLAIYKLPKDMRPFFYQNKEYLVTHSVRPDLRRNSDKSEAPKHFIDAEMYGDSALWKMPYDFTLAVEKYTKDSLEKYGYVPYWVMAMKEKLTNAFRKGDKDSILYYAADLGHYIGDAHVPLHTTVNYDGQLTNQKGLHSLWESTIPEIHLDQYQLYSNHRVQYRKAPERAIWKAVREANVLLGDVLKQEVEATKEMTESEKYRLQTRNGKETKSYTSGFARAYNKHLGNTVNEQLLEAANLYADFLYTSWVDAGKPNLNKLPGFCITRETKESMKEEFKAYRDNTLIKRGMLIARKKKDNDD